MVDRTKSDFEYYAEAVRSHRARRDRREALVGWLVFAFVVACLVGAFFIVPSRARAADPDRDRNARVALALASSAEKKDRDRDARVALAFSEHTVHPTVIYTAPPPKAKDKSGCSCGDDCKCKPGQCPACPSVKKELSRLRDSLVRVRTATGSGSGFVVWSGGGQSVVLTANHVAATGAPFAVRAEARWHAAQILASDQVADVAALLVEVELPAVAVAEADPRPGDEVLMVGVTSLWSLAKVAKCEQGYYLLSCETGPDDYSDSGDSGGGVFCRGRLVGIHCGKANGAPYCASCKPIRSLVSKVVKDDGEKLAVEIPKPMPKAAPPPAARRILYYQRVCDQGRCVLVPVYEP